jgi:hypothetical protein
MADQPGFFSNPMGYFREQAERTAAGAGKDKYGKAKDPGWINNTIGALTGATDAGTQEYRDLEKQTSLQGKYGSQLGFYKGAEVGLGEDEGSVLERLRTKKSDYERSERTKARGEIYNSPEAIRQRDTEDKRWNLTQQQYSDTRTDVANQMELTRMQMATSEKNRLHDRADAREARADELMLQRETLDRADRRDERNRRRDSIASLTSGLAALGAAFAL